MQKLRGNIKRKIGILFIALSFFYFAYIVFSHSSVLFKKYNPLAAEKIYGQSQWQQSQNISPIKELDAWALKNGFTGWQNYQDETGNQKIAESQKMKILKSIQDKGVSDSFLYSYVGYKYITGTNPSLLNPEHPPLAKYLIGKSILVFGNEHVMGIIIAFFVLLLVGAVSYQIRKSFFYVGISMLLTSLFPLFTDQLTHGPQLELYQLFFFLLVVHFLLMAMKKKKMLFFILVGISFGMLLSTKTLLPFLCLFSVWLIISLWGRWQELILLFCVGALVFCATYFSYFLQGGTLHSFLGVQKYIVTYYGNSHIPLLEFAGNYLRLIFTGSWKFWDSARSVSFYSEWNILWPMIFIKGMYGLKKQLATYKHAHLLISFIVLYNLFVFIVPIFPRYLLLLYIPLIILI